MSKREMPSAAILVAIFPRMVVFGRNEEAVDGQNCQNPELPWR